MNRRTAVVAGVFAPEALRLVEVNPGRIAGPVVRASSTRRVVTVALPTSRQGPQDGGSAGGASSGQLRAGSTVQVSLSGEVRFTGTVEKVGTVAVSSSETPGQAAPPTVAVTIVLDRVETVAALDQAPVPVRPGLLDERAGLIEVTGDGVREGMRVEVPSR